MAWADIYGKPLNQRGLATRLKRYGIKPKVVRIGDSTPRGYLATDLRDAWNRYVLAFRQEAQQAQQRNTQQAATDATETMAEDRKKNDPRCGVADVAHFPGTEPDVADARDVADGDPFASLKDGRYGLRPGADAWADGDIQLAIDQRQSSGGVMIEESLSPFRTPHDSSMGEKQQMTKSIENGELHNEQKRLAIAAPDNTGEKQDTRWQPGQSGNPAGRPKGARDRVSEKLLQVLEEDFAEHGAAVIEAVRVKRPHEYLKIVASLMPKQLEIGGPSYVVRLPEPARSAEEWVARFPRPVLHVKEIPAGSANEQALLTNEDRSAE